MRNVWETTRAELLQNAVHQDRLPAAEQARMFEDIANTVATWGLREVVEINAEMAVIENLEGTDAALIVNPNSPEEEVVGGFVGTDFYITPEFRGRGYGRELARRVLHQRGDAHDLKTITPEAYSTITGAHGDLVRDALKRGHSVPARVQHDVGIDDEPGWNRDAAVHAADGNPEVDLGITEIDSELEAIAGLSDGGGRDPVDEISPNPTL